MICTQAVHIIQFGTKSHFSHYTYPCFPNRVSLSNFTDHSSKATGCFSAQPLLTQKISGKWHINLIIMTINPVATTMNPVAMIINNPGWSWDLNLLSGAMWYPLFYPGLASKNKTFIQINGPNLWMKGSENFTISTIQTFNNRSKEGSWEHSMKRRKCW